MTERATRRGALLWERLIRHHDSAAANALLGRISDVNRYGGFLRRIVPRFEQANAAFLGRRAKKEALADEMRRRAGTQPGEGRELTPEENRCNEMLFQQIDAVHLEIETFYVFARILLDRVAEVFGALFSLTFKHGSAHGQLATRVRQKEVRQDLGDLGNTIEAFDKRIVHYRSERVEHVPDPHRQRGSFFTPTELKIRTSEAGGIDAVESENPSALLVEIDQYIDAMMAFIEAHLDDTILSRRR